MTDYMPGAAAVNPAGFLRAWRRLAVATTSLQRDPDEPFDPADDRPFTLADTPATDYWVRARKLADLNPGRHRSPAPAGSRARVRWFPCCGTTPAVGSSS
jgi:hypothetical protein